MSNVMNYDPNMTNCGRKAKQTVDLVFGLWEYRFETRVVVGGNATGLEVIDCAIGEVWDEEGPQLVLTKTVDGELHELWADDEEGKGEDWLKDMLISAQIVSIEADGRF